MLYFILIVALGLRITAVLAFSNGLLFSDSADYHQIALNFLEGKGFLLAPDAIAVRPPLYSLFLAILYSFGLGTTSVLLLQSVLGTCWVFLQYRIVLDISKNHTIALWAATLVAVDPLLIGFDALILTENMFTGLFLGLIYACLRAEKNVTINFWNWLLCGILLGFGCLCRDALLGFGVWLVVWLVLKKKSSPEEQLLKINEENIEQNKRNSFFKNRLIQIIAIILGMYCIIFPWTIRNYSYFGRVVLITSKGGQNLYEAFGPGATGGINIWEMQLPPESATMPEAERDKYLTSWTVRYIINNPSVIFKLFVEKQRRFWNIGLNYSDVKKRPIQYPIMLFNLCIYILALLGLWRVYVTKIFSQTILLLLPILYFTLLHAIFIGSVRYRVPIMPFLEAFAAWGIVWGQENIFSSLKKYRNKKNNLS